MDFELLVLSFVGTHRLFDHLDEVSLGNTAHVGDAWNRTFLTLSNLTQEVNLLEFVDGEFQISLYMLEEDLVKRLLGLSINKTVTVDTL